MWIEHGNHGFQDHFSISLSLSLPLELVCLGHGIVASAQGARDRLHNFGPGKFTWIMVRPRCCHACSFCTTFLMVLSLSLSLSLSFPLPSHPVRCTCTCTLYTILASREGSKKRLYRHCALPKITPMDSARLKKRRVYMHVERWR